jgi:hypothetical protein
MVVSMGADFLRNLRESVSMQLTLDVKMGTYLQGSTV